MSKWRPVKDCLYVIPDIHGQLRELNLILLRILPLRKSDKIIFLGDYIDRGEDSHKVVDRVMSLKEEYGDQVVTLNGNHEMMILDAIAPSKDSDDYLFWMHNGGENTICGYLERAGQPSSNPYVVDRQRVGDFIPEDHKEFFKGLDAYYETDNFLFVHGGCSPSTPIEFQDRYFLAWDRNLFHSICGQQPKNPCPKSGEGLIFDFPWDECIVTGHNGDTGEPFISNKYMMLDCSRDKKLLVFEVNSRTGFIAKQGKKRLIKLEY